MASATVSEDDSTNPPVLEQWVHNDLFSCTQCLARTPEHSDEMLQLLFNATGTPDQHLIYQQVVAIINETFGNNKEQTKEIRQQVRQLINEYLCETAQCVCLNKKNRSALRSIANEVSLIPERFSFNEETRMATFHNFERFADVYGSVKLSDYGREALQSYEKNSIAMIRGRNRYTLVPERSTFKICLQIQYFASTIHIGVCSDAVSPDDIVEASNAFPVDPLPNKRENIIFHLLINVEESTIYLWKSNPSRKNQNSEPKMRHRTISKHRCPLPWRFFVLFTAQSSHVRIIY